MPVVQGRYPDLTLLAGSFGLLVLEAKGWYPEQLIKVTDHDVELLRAVERGDRVDRHKNPIRQVREYLFGLMDELVRPVFAILLNVEGKYRGKLSVLCGAALAVGSIALYRASTGGSSASFAATAPCSPM